MYVWVWGYRALILAELTAPWTSAVNGCTETFQTGTVECEQGKFERTKQNGGFSTSQSWRSPGSWKQPHWPGWMWEKGRRREHTKEREGASKRLEVSQLHSIAICLDGLLFGALSPPPPTFSECYLHPQSYSQVWCHPSKGTCPILSSPWPLMYLTVCQL